jgi:hypothetical protein
MFLVVIVLWVDTRLKKDLHRLMIVSLAQVEIGSLGISIILFAKNARPINMEMEVRQFVNGVH